MAITCEVYGCRLCDALPASCPIATGNALWAIHEVRERAYRKLVERPDTDTSGLVDLERAETCWTCVDVNLATPHVQRLRQRALQRVRPVPSPRVKVPPMRQPDKRPAVVHGRLKRVG